MPVLHWLNRNKTLVTAPKVPCRILQVKAIALRNPALDIIHHSDRGGQYASHDYRKVFKTAKSQLMWMTLFQTRKQAIKAIGEYINGFYNPVRKHSDLGYKSPIQFETEKQKLKKLALY